MEGWFSVSSCCSCCAITDPWVHDLHRYVIVFTASKAILFCLQTTHAKTSEWTTSERNRKRRHKTSTLNLALAKIRRCLNQVPVRARQASARLWRHWASMRRRLPSRCSVDRRLVKISCKTLRYDITNLCFQNKLIFDVLPAQFNCNLLSTF